MVISLFLLLAMLPDMPAFGAGDMPVFNEDYFGQCTIPGMKLDYAVTSETDTSTGIAGEYWDENGSPQTPGTSFIDFTVSYYLNAVEAQGYYLAAKNNTIESCDVLGQYPENTILQCDTSDNESTEVYLQIGLYHGAYYLLYAEHYFLFFQFELHPPVTEQHMWDVLAQTKECMQNALTKERALTGTVTNAWGEILPGMVVKLTYNGKEQETTTDENGIYKFPFNGAFGRQARLSLVMQCRDGQTTYFTLADNLSPLTPHVVRETFTIRTEADLKHDAVIQDKQRGTEYLGDVYRDMLEALAFYQEVLKVQPEPCVVLPYSNGKTKYVPSGKGFQLRDSETIYKGYNDAYLRSPLPVFHEYSHHIMYCMYGSKFPAPPAGAAPEEKNHGGYMNPSTSDSFVEGFAQFMTRVMIASYSGGSSGAGDVNERSWDSFGYAEEDAVDGVFWDLHDGIYPLDNDSLQLTLDEIWAVLKDYRANMHEVYKGFIEAYPEKKTDIDRIFINHGFFADTNEGNKKYDFREPTWGNPELRGDPYIDLASSHQV